jgi:hypothetical protein
MRRGAKMAGDREPTFGEALMEQSLLRLYGVPVKDMSPRKLGGLIAASLTEFAYIKAYAIGDFCTRLPNPVLMAVPGAGAKPQEGDKCPRKDELVWSVLPSDRTMAMSPVLGTFDDLLEDVATRGISGGIVLENPRIQDGKACVDVHAWAKIEILGQKVEFDRRITICIPLEGCHTVWDIGWANIQVCFRAPNQICGKLCIGKWGLSKCWDYCVSVPLAVPASTPCGCGSH